ncbi:Sec-independent protein translocase protein TatA [bacterium HR23]|nr:Sec-independent protein translocase protein TatA [bacterium HR23]
MDFLNIGPMELLFILLVALLLLGPEKLVSTARRVGKAVTRFRKATEDIPTLLEEIDAPPPPPPPGAHPRSVRSTQETASPPTAPEPSRKE